LRRLLRLRPDARRRETQGLGALFVRKHEVHPREIGTCYLRSMEHINHIADRLKGSRPVIVNLEEMAPEERPRALDFISGVTYAIDGSYETVGEDVFLFVPGNVVIVEET